MRRPKTQIDFPDFLQWIFYEGRWILIGLFVVLAVLLTIRRLTRKPKSLPLSPELRGALSQEEMEDYNKLEKKGPRINLEKKTDYQKLTHRERFENVSKSFGEQEKTQTENRKNPEKNEGGLPIFTMVSPEAEEFLEENEEKIETVKKKSELQKEKEKITKTNFQKNLDEIVLGNTRAIFERSSKGELNVLAIESLIPLEDAIDGLKTQKSKQEKPQTQMQRPKIVRKRA